MSRSGRRPWARSRTGAGADAGAGVLGVGDLSLPFEAMPLPADPGLTLTAFSAEPGTPAHDAFSLLAGWAATAEPARLEEDRPPSGRGA